MAIQHLITRGVYTNRVIENIREVLLWDDGGEPALELRWHEPDTPMDRYLEGK